jgi:hypothetical protein
VKLDDEKLWEASVDVLRGNDGGGWTKAAPDLYPHQWSWDSAFIAIGWAHIDPLRALGELERLFARQWATGKVPHIVFDESVPDDSYFPDWAYWDSAMSPDAPAGAPHTSGLCQPPVHALALLRIWQLAQRSCEGGRLSEVRDRARALLPRVLAWHHYLATARDPEGGGLVTIYHPWESGADNSPRWDRALANVEVGTLPSFRRRDTEHVRDASQRPTDRDYERYIWLVEVLKACRYDEAEIQRRHPFLVKDVFFSAVLVCANVALLELAEALGADDLSPTVEGWVAAGRRGVAGQWDDELGLCVDYDVLAGNPVRLRTFAGFASLLAGNLGAEREARALAELGSGHFTGNPRLRWKVLPSTSPEEAGFQPRTYWRGPTWPIIDWLIWRALRVGGHHELAESLRREGLAQVGGSPLPEYFEPFTGEPLGSPRQSWTAAVTLDWLSFAVGAAAPCTRG